MKKIFILFQVLLIVVLESGCSLYVGEKPYNYGDSIWICEEPKITYTVKMKYDEDEKMDVPESNAVTYIDGNEVFLDFGFIGNTIRIYQLESIESKEYTGETFLNGTCKFSETKFTIKVDTESDTLFNGKYDKLVFIRQEDEKAD